MLKMGKENKSPNTKLARTEDLYFHLFSTGKEKGLFPFRRRVGENSERQLIPPFPVFAPRHGGVLAECLRVSNFSYPAGSPLTGHKQEFPGTSASMKTWSVSTSLIKLGYKFISKPESI